MKGKEKTKLEKPDLFSSAGFLYCVSEENFAMLQYHLTSSSPESRFHDSYRRLLTDP